VLVPEDFATIQEAVDSIRRGGIVEVGAGTYGPVRLGTDVGFGISLENVTIRGTTDAVIDGGGEPAISVLSARDVVVDGFTVVSQDAGVSVSQGENVAVRNVTVAAAGTDGIRVEAVTDVSVTGNRVESAGGTGISVTAGTGETYGPLVVTGNTVVSAGGDAIRVHNIGDGAEVVVSGNTVESAAARGIRTECGMTLDLSDNDVRATGGAGISVDRVVDRTSVTQNTVTDAGGAGVEFTYGVLVVVADNRIDGTAGDGVAGSLAAGAAIRGNSGHGRGRCRHPHRGHRPGDGRVERRRQSPGDRDRPRGRRPGSRAGQHRRRSRRARRGARRDLTGMSVTGNLVTGAGTADSGSTTAPPGTSSGTTRRSSAARASGWTTPRGRGTASPGRTASAGGTRRADQRGRRVGGSLSYEQRTIVVMPPRALNSPETVIRRGASAFTSTSRISLVAAS
jgi:hypothetical protein